MMKRKPKKKTKTKTYKVHHQQEFMGKVIEGSFIRTINVDSQFDEMMDIENVLYSDPHVISVWFEELEEFEEGK